MASPVLRTAGFVSVLALILPSCGGSSPAAPAPTPTGPTLASIRVGVAGDAAPALTIGQSLQFFALAVYSDQHTEDVTNVALWQSSDPVVATVSSGGLVTAAAAGTTDIKATFMKVIGTLRADVKARPLCTYKLSPSSRHFTAFGDSSTVTVTASSSECRWTATSRASWLPLDYDPARAGSGAFTYIVPPNSTPDTRSTDVVVAGDGTPARHHVSQDHPASCSYMPVPDSTIVSAAGGPHAFTVQVTPDDCRWTARVYSGAGYVWITSGTSGTGTRTIRYSVVSISHDAEAQIWVEGLSGANPPGIFKIRIVR